MRNTGRVHLLLVVLTSMAYSAGIHIQGEVLAQGAPDEAAPVMSLLSPVSDGGIVETDRSVMDLEGVVSDDTGVRSVRWQKGQDGGYALGMATDWDGPFSWKVQGIVLQEGPNDITVTAWDPAGNAAAVSLTVMYTVPQPVEIAGLINRKAKFTFFFTQDGIDRFSIYIYLLKETDDLFVMPFDMDVTVSVEVPDPRDPSEPIRLYTETIPAGTVTGTSKYVYKSGPGGIRTLIFQESTSTQTYMYVYVEDVDLLPDIKPTMSTEDYWVFVRGIARYEITVQAGKKTWSGDALLTPGYYSSHKQELVYNR